MRKSIIITVLAATCMLTACGSPDKNDETPDIQPVTTLISETQNKNVTTTNQTSSENTTNEITTTQNITTIFTTNEMTEETSKYTTVEQTIQPIVTAEETVIISDIMEATTAMPTEQFVTVPAIPDETNSDEIVFPLMPIN